MASPFNPPSERRWVPFSPPVLHGRDQPKDPREAVLWTEVCVGEEVLETWEQHCHHLSDGEVRGLSGRTEARDRVGVTEGRVQLSGEFSSCSLGRPSMPPHCRRARSLAVSVSPLSDLSQSPGLSHRVCSAHQPLWAPGRLSWLSVRLWLRSRSRGSWVRALRQVSPASLSLSLSLCPSLTCMSPPPKKKTSQKKTKRKSVGYAVTGLPRPGWQIRWGTNEFPC